MLNYFFNSQESGDPNSEINHHTNEVAQQVPFMIRRHLPHCYVNKSSSMPNLKNILNNQQQSNPYNAVSNSSVRFFK